MATPVVPILCLRGYAECYLEVVYLIIFIHRVSSACQALELDQVALKTMLQ